ncbi:MAG: hypothetical protein AAGJ32_10365 [Pseudomonadota bacterium]
MVEKQTDTSVDRSTGGSLSGQGENKPMKVMGNDGTRPADSTHGCSDLRHPHLPYWHPLNGPFPSD